jgi:hypothetical protein
MRNWWFSSDSSGLRDRGAVKRSHQCRALTLAHPGTAIIVDNVVRDGRVVGAASGDAMVRGTRRLFDYLATEPDSIERRWRWSVRRAGTGSCWRW